jgi:hypothetical protein
MRLIGVAGSLQRRTRSERAARVVRDQRLDFRHAAVEALPDDCERRTCDSDISVSRTGRQRSYVGRAILGQLPIERATLAIDLIEPDRVARAVSAERQRRSVMRTRIDAPAVDGRPLDRRLRCAEERKGVIAFVRFEYVAPQRSDASLAVAREGDPAALAAAVRQFRVVAPGRAAVVGARVVDRCTSIRSARLLRHFQIALVDPGHPQAALRVDEQRLEPMRDQLPVVMHVDRRRPGLAAVERARETNVAGELVEVGEVQVT